MRRLFDIATLLSLILFLIAIVLVLATHFFPRVSTRALTPSIERRTEITEGYIHITQTTTLASSGGITRSTETIVEIYFGPIAVLSSILPLVWICSARSSGRNFWRGRHWLCQKCGYDLRGSPERCPECGTPALNPWLQNRRKNI